jgi:hypothetical protein
MPTFQYRREVLEELLRHGLRPTATTAPSVARDVLNDMYRFELRRIRQRLIDGQIERRAYADIVRGIRERYPLLSLPLSFWLAPSVRTVDGGPAGSSGS